MLRLARLQVPTEQKEIKMKAFEMIVKDGNHAYVMTRPGKDKKSIMHRYSGNGEFVRVQDVTEETPISLDKVRNALKLAGFGEVEQDIIVSLVQEYDGAY